MLENVIYTRGQAVSPFLCRGISPTYLLSHRLCWRTVGFPWRETLKTLPPWETFPFCRKHMARLEHNMRFWRIGHPPRKRKMEGEGKHLQAPREDSVTFPFPWRGWERPKVTRPVWETWPSPPILECSFSHFPCVSLTMALQAMCCYCYYHYRWRNGDFERLSNISKEQEQNVIHLRPEPRPAQC